MHAFDMGLSENVAYFWIDMKQVMVLLNYICEHDPKATYLDTAELVTMAISHPIKVKRYPLYGLPESTQELIVL